MRTRGDSAYADHRPFEAIKAQGKLRTWIISAALVASLLVTSTLHAEPYRNPMKPLFDALYIHESVSGTVLTGDGGLSRGPYHIQRRYWIDGIRQLRREGSSYIADEIEDYEANVNDRWASEVIICAVARCYEPQGYARADFEVLARLHNGSRRWREKVETVRYWKKIQALLERAAG